MTVCKIKLCFLLLFLALVVNYMAGAEEPSTTFKGEIEHVEITLPQQLLPGYPVIDRPVSMEEAVEIGMENNPDVQVFEAEKGYRKSLLKIAKAKRWPTVTAGSFSFLRTQNTGFLRTPGIISRTVSNDTYSQELSLFASMPLFTGGQIHHGIKASRYAWQAADEALKDKMLQSALAIRKAYLSAELAKVQHHIHQQHQKKEEELLRIARARYTHGKGLKSDVLNVQAEVAQAKQHLNQHHNHLNSVLFELKAKMGIDLGSEIKLTDTLKVTEWSGGDLNAIVRNALEAHPRIIQARKNTSQAKAQWKATLGQYLPQVTGQVSGNVRIPENEPELGSGVVGMFTVSLPVFNRERDHKVAAAKRQYVKMTQVEKSVEVELTKEIAQAWSEMTFARDNVAQAKVAVESSREELRLIQKRFEVGRALNVEVQDAVLTFLQAQLAHVQAVYEHEVARAKVIRSSGLY